MGKDSFKYVLICMGIYLGFAIVEIFLIKLLIDLITTNFIAHMLIYNVLLLVVNPLAVKLIVDKCFDFKADTIETSQNI